VVELTVIDGGATGEADRDPSAVARVYGRLVHEVPTDLYIPPEALEIFLESFEGPLDLLLYLIRRHNLDVLDIPMAELAAEYLLMAAVLIEIKSRMLLPRPEAAASEAEPEDPRAELVRRLLEYEQMKLAAERLDRLPQAGRDFANVLVAADANPSVHLPDVDPEDLRQAWLGLLARARMTRHHRVTREQLSVREHMTRILRALRDRSYAEFSELFDPTRGVPELVVTLLAILELGKEYLVSITQQAAFAPIYVSVKDGSSLD
jgi:segregation and condensation protein A